MTLYYSSLIISYAFLSSPAVFYPVDCAHPDEWDEEEIDIEWDYDVDDDLVVEYLFELLRFEEEYATKTDDELWEYIEDNLDNLADAYLPQLLAHFEDSAREDAEENYTPPEPDYDDYYD